MLYGRGYIPDINPADTPVQVPVAYGSNLRLSLRPKPDRKNIWQIIQIGYNALTRRRPVRLSFSQESSRPAASNPGDEGVREPVLITWSVRHFSTNIFRLYACFQSINRHFTLTPSGVLQE